MKKFLLPLAAALALATTASLPAQPLVNLGLVGVGRISGDSFDQFGFGIDTLGGIFSGLWLDPVSIVKAGDTYSATLYALPDRGFGDGLRDYHPRIQRLSFSITPYYGSGPVAQNQIAIDNTGTLALTVAGSTFTGANPDDTNVTTHPQSLVTSVGLGKWSLDPEGIARAGDGSYYVSDEYGPFIYHFDPFGGLLDVLAPPDAYLPKIGATFPRVVNFLTASTIATNDSGRYINRGLEGLSITPSGKKLVTVLQSPLVQDGQNRNPSRNTRILVFDIDPLSPTYHQPVAEYVLVLTLNAAEAGNRHTPISEILALSDTKYLVLERDSRGLGGDPGALLYKRIVMVDAAGASNILGTGYDLEKGAPGALSLPRSGLPSNVVAVARKDLVDLLNPAQLAKYGLNTLASNQNANTLSEKWEGMAVLPLNDPAAPNDYLLLVGNDNDFKASVVFHNGVPVGTNDLTIDNMLLAFRIGEDHIPPTLACPFSLTVSASTNCTLPSILGSVTASDNSAAPVTLTMNPPRGTAVTLGVPLNVTVTATDAAGNSTNCVVPVTVLDRTPPTISCPGNLVVNTDPGLCTAVVNFTATASDNCAVASFSCTPPSGYAFPKGTNAVVCAATDPSGNVTTCTFTIVVVDAEAPTIAAITPSSTTLWPPNHRMFPVTLRISASDNCDAKPRCEIINVTSSEDSSTPDWQVTGPLNVNLRAERLSNGPGRVYTLTVRCTDSSGNSSVGTTTVLVPHDQSPR